MHNKPINPDLAWRMRNDRGLELPTNREYTIPRLKEIALLRSILQRRLEDLDKEIEQLAKG